MKSILLNIVGICLSAGILAQNQVVNGVIYDVSNNETLPGVNIVLKNTSIGTITDANGAFSLEVPADGTLVISYIGFAPQEIAIQGKAEIEAYLQADLVALNEVVVTAYGIKKEQNKLGYAVQNVSSGELNRVADPNVGSALRGKLAGINVNANSGGIGSSVSINVRGISSLGPNNQPLIVLDGVLIDNNQGSQGDFAGGLDYGNTLSNLNPNDIESISVLKGGNATALYGFRGNNGVIVITTKRGTSEKAKVEISSTVTTNSILVTPNLQNQYGHGFFDTGSQSLVYDITRGSSYGPRMDGTQQTRFDEVGTAEYSPIGSDQFKDFFQTGVSLLNSVAISQAKENFDYRMSYSRSDDESIVPGSELNRQNFSLKTGADLTSWLKVTGKIDYINQYAKNRPELTDGQSNLARALSLRPRNISNGLLEQNFLTNDGTPNNWSGSFILNPYYTVNTRLNEDRTDRYIGLLEFNAKLTDEFNVLARLSRDFITTTQDIFNPVGAFDIAANGRLVNIDSRTLTNNYDLILTYNKIISDNFDLTATAGVSRTESSFESSRATGETFLIPNFFSFNNFETVQLSPSFLESVSNSVFGSLTFGFNQFIFTEVTARNDWSSTLPIDNASFFYPSVGLSVVLSDGIASLKNSKTLSHLKLRGSYAQTGNATTPFSLINTYNTSSNLFNGQRFFFFGQNEEGAGLGPELRNPELVPEQSNTWEFGLDARFLNDRLSLNATYFSIRTSNQILSLTLPPASGAASQIINAGLITNKGLEVSLSADIIKTGDFSWSTVLNYTTVNNVVEELTNGVDRNILVRQFNDIVQVAAEVGSSPQALYGSKFERDDAGNIVYDITGLPVASEEIGKIGDAAPDAFTNWTNTLGYKKFTLSFLLDAKIGGDLFSFSEIERHVQGTATETLRGREFYDGGQGIPVPDGAVIQEGGTLNPTAASRGVDPQSYWTRLGTISEHWVVDGSFVKLREVSLGYTFPRVITDKIGFASLSLSYVGRNLAILHSNTPNFDPETGFNTSFSGVEYYGIPTARSHGFRLNIGF